ncbi:uncharacterized protein LOC105030821 [Esox lucius]|uniref:uncharacterized protein LOC105030821 n=1 Tax=Esox lucius TaxID=8010 RepID=UPI0014770E00|nr:uncharacterized protein LOC105030821 [Esox lucius]
MSAPDASTLFTGNIAERDNGSSIIFDFFDAVDSGGRLRPAAIPDLQQLQEMPTLSSLRKPIESQNHNYRRSPRIALCSCEGLPIVTPICLRAVSSQDELKNRLQRQLVTPIHQRDEYKRRTKEADAKVKTFERKALLVRAQVNALRHGQVLSNSVSKQLQEMRAQLRNWTTAAQQLHRPSTQLQIPNLRSESDNNDEARGPGDNFCSYCGQPLTAISIGFQDAMRSRQELKNSFQRQLAMVMKQRHEYKRRAREAEAKVRVWERRNILMKAQVRAAREAFLTVTELGNRKNPEPNIV